MMVLTLLAASTAALIVEPKFQRPSVVCDRRHFLRFAATCGTAASLRATAAHADAKSMVLQYDSEGKLLDDYDVETQFRTLKQGPASMQILSAWQAKDDGSYFDLTLGSAASAIVMTSTKTDVPDTAALGKPERVDVVETLALEPELVRADLVAASIRKVDGVTFYDYDLALSPKKCNTEMATACLPEKVILLSVGIRAGELHVVRLDASADQWKRAGTALRLARSSFSVAA